MTNKILRVGAALMMFVVFGMMMVAPVIGAPLANAQQLAQVEGLPISPVDEVDDVIGIMDFIVDIIFTILMVLAVIFILYAAFKYLTGGAGKEGVGAASQLLIYAAVAIAVALVAQGVRLLVANILQRGVGQ